MSRDKGNRAPKWVAALLRDLWPSAEATPNGRAGSDILGTPGISWEIKTGTAWRQAWLQQAAKYPGLTVLVYVPPGCGEAQVGNAQAIVPLSALLDLLKDTEYV